MKVLFAIKALDNIQGGAERVLADVTSGLTEKGHEIEVLTFDPPGGNSFYPLHEKVKRISLGIGNVQQKATFLEIISRMVAIRKTVKKTKPDAVVAFMHSTFIPASLALTGTGIPVIASEHIVPNHYKNRKWEYLLLILSRFFVTKITVLSPSIIESYPKFLRSKMIAIANPVHSPKIHAKPEGNKTNHRTILNVGRLDPQKDQETLIKSFAMLENDYPEWTLKILGEGNLRPTLENLIQELNLQNRVKLPGITTNIEKEYQDAHIFALSSQYESFGLATAEAMAHALPTIGFASCPGTNELITDQENGLLIKGDNRTNSFAQGMKTLMDDSELRKKMGQAGLKTIRRFHPDNITTQWESIIIEARDT